MFNQTELFFDAGLIIDAFGELRDQQEQVKEDMEVHECDAQLTYMTQCACVCERESLCVQCQSVMNEFLLQTKCFICGIGSDYFDTTPHGFETHTLEEHNLANYL